MKAESNVNQQEGNLEEDDNITFLVMKFGKFLQREKKKDLIKGIDLWRRETPTSNQNFTYFECGKQGHIKADCLSF